MFVVPWVLRSMTSNQDYSMIDLFGLLNGDDGTDSNVVKMGMFAARWGEMMDSWEKWANTNTRLAVLAGGCPQVAAKRGGALAPLCAIVPSAPTTCPPQKGWRARHGI